MNFGVASTLRSTEVSGTCVDKFMNRKFLTKTGNITCQLCIIDVCVPIQNLGSLSSSTSKESQNFDNSATGFPWNQPCHHPAWYLGLAWQYTLDYIKLCHDGIQLFYIFQQNFLDVWLAITISCRPSGVGQVHAVAQALATMLMKKVMSCRHKF